MMNKINSVCVYCASSTKIDSVYFDAARELGALLGQRQIRLKWKACTNGKRQWPT